MTVQTAYLIDEDLKRKFKTMCARRGVTMSEQITNYISDFVDNDPLGDEFWSNNIVVNSSPIDKDNDITVVTQDNFNWEDRLNDLA